MKAKKILELGLFFLLLVLASNNALSDDQSTPVRLNLPKGYAKTPVIIDRALDPSGKQLFFKTLKGKLIPITPPESIRPLQVTTKLISGLMAFKATLNPATASIIDLRNFQTPPKDQGTLPNCYHTALVGAIEAAYKTRCLKHPILANTEPYCTGYTSTNVRELSLSVWQLARDLASQSSTHNPAALHENICLVCGPLRDSIFDDSTVGWRNDGPILATIRHLRLAEESEAPYLASRSNYQLNWFLINESCSMGFMTATSLPSYPSPAFCDWLPGIEMQQRYDNYHYDPFNVPYDASYRGRYAIKELQGLPQSDVTTISALEQYLANQYTVAIAFPFAGLACGTDTINGATKCSYFGNHLKPEDSFANGGGHWMLLVGYDRPAQRFLLKNSWGSDDPYISVPYRFLQERATTGYIVKNVMPATQANETHEGAYLGMWHVFDRNNAYQGRLVVHRTRSTPDELPDFLPNSVSAPSVVEDPRLKKLTRVGTFYKYQNGNFVDAQWVAGQLNTSNYLRLYLGNHVGSGGDPLGTKYEGGQFWGTMVLGSPDTARDGLNQIYVRDFFHRAMHNWLGSWSITKSDGGRMTISISEIDRVPSPDGKYRIKGTLGDSAERTIVGTIDNRGTHALLENQQADANKCVLDARFARTVTTNGLIDDQIMSGSVMQCDGSTPVGITGKRKPLVAPL